MQTFANNVSIWLAELSTLGTTPYKIVTVAMPIAKRRSDVLPRCQLCIEWIYNDNFRQDYICSQEWVRKHYGPCYSTHLIYLHVCLCTYDCYDYVPKPFGQNLYAKHDQCRLSVCIRLWTIQIPCFVLMTPHVALGSVAHFDWWKCATPMASCSNSE